MKTRASQLKWRVQGGTVTGGENGPERPHLLGMLSKLTPRRYYSSCKACWGMGKLPCCRRAVLKGFLSRTGYVAVCVYFFSFPQSVSFPIIVFHMIAVFVWSGLAHTKSKPLPRSFSSVQVTALVHLEGVGDPLSAWAPHAQLPHILLVAFFQIASLVLFKIR